MKDSGVVIVTGAGGLVGVESVNFFSKYFEKIIGVDNDSRGYFFGKGGSVAKNIEKLVHGIDNYEHYPIDIRDRERIRRLFQKYGASIKLIINTAAQPSHDWSGMFPYEDFEINALGTVILLEEMRNQCPKAVFIQCSSSKVYGDALNSFVYEETNSRFELAEDHTYYNGFREDMPIDQSLHSPYGAGKLASDVMCQEYARYYGLNIGIFRPNCITGGPHSGVELHGFLSYLVKCTTPYNVFGYRGKQVRDNIHAFDLVRAFYEFYLKPNAGEVYNLGGGRANSCSIIEAIELVDHVIAKKVEFKIIDSPRIGDHIWWITDNRKFISQYPNWSISIGLNQIITEIWSNTKQIKNNE
jgi:CDP-paratose 2-epimerase